MFEVSAAAAARSTRSLRASAASTAPRVRVLASIAALGFTAACSDDVRSPLAPESSGAASAAAGAAAARPQIDRPDELPRVELSRVVPAFAGLHYEGDRLIVHLTDRGQSAAARGHVQAMLRAHGEPAPSSIEFRTARFSFSELREWRDRMVHPLFEIDGYVLSYIDEPNNRLHVGVRTAADVARVAALANEFEVPLDAVHMEEDEEIFWGPQLAMSDPPASWQWIRGEFRPLTGGIQIQYNSGGQAWQCTLGLVVRWSGYDAFLTNSHCSSQMWSLDHTVHHQPWVSSGAWWRVGFEAHDPGGSSCGFMWTSKCRYSDAAISRVDGGVGIQFGTIARTYYSATDVGSLDIDPAKPRFTITGEASSQTVGTLVNKMGRTTGWTRGSITAICVDGKPSTWRKTYCNTLANYGSQGGDSGAPVFRVSSDNAIVHGINWGTRKKTGEALYSPMTGIRRDLGSFSIMPSSGGTGGGGGGGGGGDCMECLQPMALEPEMLQ
jgi:hypothetical protein